MFVTTFWRFSRHFLAEKTSHRVMDALGTYTGVLQEGALRAREKVEKIRATFWDSINSLNYSTN